MSPNKEKSRFLVTPRGFDDIGAVLSEMGDAFACVEIDWDMLEKPGSLDGCEVLFINCACESLVYAERIAPSIQEFVKNGGSLYCSDWAGAVLKAAFPNVFDFGQSGTKCELECSVVDEGLRELIGQTIGIHFDLSSWWRITKARGDFRCFVVGPNKMPVVAGFVYGRGNVIYTSFHNEAQLSEKEKKLLRYLVLRPILAKVAGSAAQFAKDALCTPGREILATIDRSQPSVPYVYNASGSERLLYVLSWLGTGQLRMVVTDPSGKIRHDSRVVSPIQFEALGTPGKWTCVIEASSIPHDNFPYVLTMATRKQAAGQSVPAVPVRSQAPKPQSSVAPSTTFLTCYVLIDCSRWASDVGPAIGQGVSIFIRGLSKLPVTNVIPVLSIVEIRAGVVTVQAPKKISELGQINLSCKGDTVLKPALTGLLSALATTNAQYAGNTLVVILLAANPSDEFHVEAQQIKKLAALGKINVVAVGLGSQVSDSTLSSLSTIPLRIMDPSGQNCIASFEWLVKVAASMKNLKK